MAFLLAHGNVIYDGQIVAPDRVLAEFKPALSPSALAAIAASLDATYRPVGGAGAILFQSRDLPIPTLEADLRARSDLVYVETDPVRIPASTPNDPDFLLQWYLNNVGQCVPEADASICSGTAGDDIGYLTALNYAGQSNPEPVVAVLDTGLYDPNSPPDINVWQAPASFTLNLGAGPFTCPEGTSSLRVVTGDSGCGGAIDNSTDGHGTAMAGIIGSITNNDVGIAGVGYDAQVFPIRVFASDGTIHASDDADGIEAAVQVKNIFGSAADIVAVNMSFQNIHYGSGSGYNQTEINELNRAAQYGILAVVAAGNNCATSPDYPAAFYLPNEIVVGASDQNDNVSVWTTGGCSNEGAEIAAPGTNIWTVSSTGGFVSFSGTSPATAVVSGAVALVDERCRVPWPQMEQLLYGTAAHPAGIPASFAAHGRLNLGAAVQECATAVPSAGSITFAGQESDAVAPAVICPKCCPGPDCPPRLTPAFGTITVSMYNWSWSASWNACCDSAVNSASAVAAAITADPTAPVLATTPGAGNAVTLTTVAGGPYTDYAFKVTMVDQCVSSSSIECEANPYSFSTTPITGGH